MADQPTDLLDEMLPPKDAAEILRNKPSTLADWRWRGIGPRFYRLGGRVFYRRADLLDWAAKQGVNPAEKQGAA